MATDNHTEAQRVVHRATAQLAALGFMDQGTARELAPMAEAVADLFMVVFYQAETGRATHLDFNTAMAAVRRSLSAH
ncbi:type I toxin-antitoxin system ptaRNA1 family toxin [Burkholderia pseudomallei]|jgi:hypothetical protein|uniref:type I toxin-antitoxin system ptaRNA1 family toxin n=1 Tax=Burkholderia TaxID=32008 RepID=UPI0007591427|nr:MULTISPECIES: type I toxin-antitoxin system ptaRNA1 family toxin [Burkholderia]HEF5875744.1 type I toxin-antitoxin system ptaRNA1 family toxin [Burkholderia cenocepacia]KVA50075.1 toxin of toxin-antitoxin type 1 system [Burkholderia cepacia]KVC22261.1 toxin of toxin-antitoxin type 1 system [Burkholderia cepacia]MBO7888643.1 type I toxin-antitoxin system ptaRNA1 family toxin [Burkholderia pseudomallei]MBO7895028.1 type I toxin-antitoxin system ptaRNA1 family toxin [Burkholderia pseudomallei]